MNKKTIFSFIVVLVFVTVLITNTYLPVSTFAETLMTTNDEAVVIEETKKIDDEIYLIKTKTDDIKRKESVIYRKQTERDILEYFYKKDTSIIEELLDQFDTYKKMYESSAISNSAQLLDLINTTADLIKNYYVQTNTTYDEVLRQSYIGSSIRAQGENDSPQFIIDAAISFFNISGYKLSAELLTYATDSSHSDNEYTPIYGSRVYSSQVTYDIIETPNTIQQYPLISTPLLNSQSRNEEDLFFALNNFVIEDLNQSSKTYRITDEYNFDNAANNFILQILVNMFNSYMQNGYIYQFKTVIDVDLNKPVKLNVLSYQQNNGIGFYDVNISNYSNTPISVIYNTKMCNENDARNWTNLVDNSYVVIEANSNATVTIYENFAATHIVFSYVLNGIRFITFADGVQVGTHINVELKEQNFTSYTYSQLLGKNGTNWLLRLNNPYYFTVSIQYNSKLCNYSDARNWSNLNDVNTITLLPGEEVFVYISENFLATTIATRLFGLNSGIYVLYAYANELNVNNQGVMNMNTEIRFNYLDITNLGRSGSGWRIRITNPFSVGISVYYNKKMCNYSDAQNWTNLSDISTIYIAPNSATTVYISENWFATSIAMSYIYGQNRLITYANGLSNNGGISIHYNQISL
ncbi:MAG: hypothetical protein IJ811_03615 [Clostridia bacterium]|nr:hypothetical protein [Clostridia bacterium]